MQSAYFLVNLSGNIQVSNSMHPNRIDHPALTVTGLVQSIPFLLGDR